MTIKYLIAAQDGRFLSGCLIVAAVLFGTGVAGMVLRRSLFSVFISLAVAVQAIILAATAFSGIHGTWSGQVLSLFVLVVTAVQGCLLLAFAFAITRRPCTEDKVESEHLAGSAGLASNDETTPANAASEVSDE